MSMDNVVSLEELERRRKAASARRKSSLIQRPPQAGVESEALSVINEIFNPTLKLPETSGQYKLPEELSATDEVAEQDLDTRKLAELKEVFLLFDVNSDGLISKDDLRFTFTALGGDVSEDQLEDMLKEAKDPLDYNAFIELIFHRTAELDPEDVLLEAWSKWDDFGTGKIDEKNCLDYVEVFPYLREPIVENSTLPEYVFCNQSAVNVTSPLTMHVNATDWVAGEFIYSASKIFGIRVTFTHPPKSADANPWPLNVSAEYRFLKRENFQNDGRLIPGSYCDYYFFAEADAKKTSYIELWQYFHSPRFPAKYPAHIQCAYKFIGRPEGHVEVIFEELRIPKHNGSCNTDKLTIFDSESANMNAVIEVLCDAMPTRRIVSSGPDLLIELNVSSNTTAKGFRGKFKFTQNDTKTKRPSTANATEPAVVMEKIGIKKPQIKYTAGEVEQLFKNIGE